MTGGEGFVRKYRKRGGSSLRDRRTKGREGEVKFEREVRGERFKLSPPPPPTVAEIHVALVSTSEFVLFFFIKFHDFL